MFEKKYEMKLSKFELIFIHVACFTFGGLIGMGITMSVFKLLGL